MEGIFRSQVDRLFFFLPAPLKFLQRGIRRGLMCLPRERTRIYAGSADRWRRPGACCWRPTPLPRPNHPSLTPRCTLTQTNAPYPLWRRMPCRFIMRKTRRGELRRRHRRAAAREQGIRDLSKQHPCSRCPLQMFLFLLKSGFQLFTKIIMNY